MITEDMAHVLLDALTALTAEIENHQQPWMTYDGGTDDPKVSRVSYLQLMDEAERHLELILESGVAQ